LGAVRAYLNREEQLRKAREWSAYTQRIDTPMIPDWAALDALLAPQQEDPWNPELEAAE
jgi:hypothetical protein